MTTVDGPDIPDDKTELSEANEVSLRPGPSADPDADVERFISQGVRDLYDVYSYRHAASILFNSFPNELSEIEEALLNFRITMEDIGTPGGNESIVPKKLSEALRPSGWYEARIQGDLTIRLNEYDETPNATGGLTKKKRAIAEPRTIENFIDGHKIDYVKGRVAFDVEWNSKDQTFDRDLYAFRAFHECGLISSGVMLTRSASLNPVFEVAQRFKDGVPVVNAIGEPLTVKTKYGASTTWMGKLLYRLDAGRHGGCPVLIFGITPRVISDWPV